MVLLFGNAVGIVLALLILAPYVLAYIFSQKKPVWLTVALILVAIDLLILLWIGITYNVLLYQILNVLVHIGEIVILAMGIKYSKASTEALAPQAEPDGTMPQSAAYTADPQTVPNAAAPQRTAQAGDEGSFTDVVCSVSVSEDGQRHTIETAGVVRFYAHELVLGTNSMASTILLGAALTKTSEKMRFAYSDIAKVYEARKNGRTVRIDLRDGRYAFLILTNSAREELAMLFGQRGIRIEPFVRE